MKHCPRAVSIARPSTLQLTALPSELAGAPLNDTEQRYANIEREMLAYVFGAERFHTYVFGKPFTIETDHKPLECIINKALTAAPARLQ